MPRGASPSFLLSLVAFSRTLAEFLQLTIVMMLSSVISGSAMATGAIAISIRATNRRLIHFFIRIYLLSRTAAPQKDALRHSSFI